MMRRWFVRFALAAAVVAAVLGCAPAPPESGDVSALTAFFDERVPELMARYGVPGVSMALVHEGQPVWSAAYGVADRESGRPMTVDTICRSESISKSVTAWGVLSLVEDGVLELAQPVAPLLAGEPFVFLDRAEGRTITFHHLLSNQSGLALGTVGPPTEYAPGEPRPSLSEFIAPDAAPVQVPGRGFLYSDVGFNTLQLSLERATAASFPVILKQQVLRPLGMTDSSFGWVDAYEGRVATGYELDGTPVAPYVYPAEASGGLFVTAADLARFVAAGMLSRDDPGVGVIGRSSLEEIYEPRVEIPGLYGNVADAYGYGHFIEILHDGRRAVWHGGQGHGWMTHFHSIPESGDGIIVLTNSQRSWPFMAALLPIWSEWAGAGRVSFGVITPATRVFWAVIIVAALVVLGQILRLAFGTRSGVRRFAPFAKRRRGIRLLGLAGGLALILLVLWRMSLPYIDEASIFPSAASVAAVVFIALGAVLVISSVLPLRPDEQS